MVSTWRFERGLEARACGMRASTVSLTISTKIRAMMADDEMLSSFCRRDRA